MSYQSKIVDLWLSDNNEEYKILAAFKIGLEEGERREREATQKRKREARKITYGQKSK